MKTAVSSEPVTPESAQSLEAHSPEAYSPDQSGLQVFATTFVTIFLAELGDKTQVTTLLISAESHKPWIVFLGAGSALITTSLLGVLLGRWLATRLSPQVLNKSAGIMLLLIAAGLSWDVVSNGL
ncbi:MAG: TMEM165/GDT1 family protein [Synechococcales cyanobacterium CRU_2_2]|nr:TMEM165/GDT1 family protein [Synechococcales cyanobacterium CRU_2_2]